MSQLHAKFIRYLDNIVAKSGSKTLLNFWNYNAGPKTIFFWAPLVKWGLVIATLADTQRPVETISIYQHLALAATGLIWSRYSLVIYPVNYSLFGVNATVFCTNTYQVVRVYHFKYLLTEEERQLVLQKKEDE